MENQDVATDAGENEQPPIELKRSGETEPSLDETQGTFKLSKEAANKQMEVLLDHYEVDMEDKHGKETDEYKAFCTLKRDMIGGIRRGKIYFDSDEKLGFMVIQKLKSGEVIKYRELSGNDRVMMGKYKKHIEKVYGLLAAMARDLDIMDIRKLKGPDSKRAELIGTFLLLI